MSTSLQQIFERFNQLNILIIGDVMIDAYYFGQVDRISPEAPVPVVAVDHKENRLGGAANVAQNIRALGANPVLCSVIGDDEEASTLNDLLKQETISGAGILRSKERVTTIKTRVIGNKHQMLRIDREMTAEITTQENELLLERIKQLLPDADAVIFEDYDKGVLNEYLISETIKAAKALNKPTIVDPKKRNFLAYKDCTFFKPNLKEIREGLNTHKDLSQISNLEDALGDLHQRLNNEIAMVTMSEQGVLITDYKQTHHIPAHIRNIADVSGAGDTVVSVATLCLALGLPLKTVAELANLAGGLVCEKVGVVPIEKAQLMEEAALLGDRLELVTARA